MSKQAAKLIEPNPVGAPSKYNAKFFPKTCAFLARRGATLSEMADSCDVDIRTFSRWLVEYPELGDAVANGKSEMFDPRVERSLAERALGFYADSYIWRKDEATGKLELIPTERKYHPPEVAACIFWLKNRQPDKWRDVQRHVVEGQLKSSDELRQLLAAEFKDLIDQGLLKLPAPMKEINPKRSKNGE